MHVLWMRRPPGTLGVPGDTLGVLGSEWNPNIFLCPYLKNMMASFLATIISFQPTPNPNLVPLDCMSVYDSFECSCEAFGGEGTLKEG